MNTWLRTTVVVLIVLAVGAGSFVFYVAHHGYSAAVQPSPIEVFIARRLRLLATPSDAKLLKNPESTTPETYPAVSAHWMEHCATCHGTDGGGDTVFGRNIYPKAPDMKTAATQDLSDGEIFYIINNGVRFTGMPAWKDEDSPQELWQLVAFIRRLPHLTPDELKLMEQKAKEHAGEEDADEEQEHHQHGQHEERQEHGHQTP